MSKPSRRPNREKIKAENKQYKKAQRELLQDEKARGLQKPSHGTISNCKCRFESIEEEGRIRNETVVEHLSIFRSKLPVLLKRLAKIQDPRNPKKIKHQVSTLMIYGILTFVFQMSSCREANREMTQPMFWKNLRYFFPELETLPHHDTLKRLLAKIDISQIEKLHLDLIKDLIRKKKFRRYLINNCYPIAIDGTGKFKRDWLWEEECLERNIKKEDGTRKQYHVYVLEANLAFCDGMTIPLMSEILSYTKGDTGNNKQDCELKAFYRLASRLKKAFPALKIMVLLDGLYAKGPVAEICRKNKWQFMIVLKDGALPSVMKKFEALSGLEKEKFHQHTWGNRKQVFRWVNGIDYRFESNDKKRQVLHVVECQESWNEIDRESGKPEEKNSRHVWISSEPLNKFNLHERCNL
ncbi:MAG: transposase family protein, partial [Candidatus Parabeggiatoa sp.]|nr:transposase family protein [Candidatus Parabeggiatoa sp.]